MLRAAGRVRLFTDADNSTDITHFEKMKPFFDDGYDVVIASRNSGDATGAEEAVPQTWYKRWTGRLGNHIVQLLVVPGILGNQCGFKGFCGGVGEGVFFQTTIESWGFGIEVLEFARAEN